MLRLVFQGAIEKYITERHGIDVRNKILFNFNVENPRIPIIHYCLDRYILGAVKRSVLVHDNSPFLLGLGRAYIENSSMTIYAQPDLKIKLEKMLSEDPDFYKKDSFLKEIIAKITLDSLHTHDYLLFIITSLAKDIGDRTIEHFSEITAEYKRIRRIKQTEYDYSKYDRCYDHETKESFDYPGWLFNALILFDVCKLVDIELVTSPYKEVEGKKLYTPKYNFKVRAHPHTRLQGRYFIPLYLAIRNYPTTVAQFFNLDQKIPAVA
jgi:hypothetical protein